MKTNLIIRFGIIAALAIAAIAHGVSQPEPSAFDRFEPTYNLTLDTPSGDRYVIDHNLTSADCFAAMDNAENPERDRLACQTPEN